MINKETFTLNNGVKIPKLGLGTWLLSGEQAYNSTLNALKMGYRHIDTAQAYFNEVEVGKAVKDSGIPREEIFITSKVAAEIKDYEGAKRSIAESLDKLDTYIDLMLIHCPQPWNSFRRGDYSSGNKEVWKALEDYYRLGKIKAIGLSNFLEEDIEAIKDAFSIYPMANQILMHIGETDLATINYCKEHNILIEAYSPLAHGAALTDKNLETIASKYGVSVPQLCIRYPLDMDCVSLPKATSNKHLEENMDVNFTISKEDLEILKTFKGPKAF